MLLDSDGSPRVLSVDALLRDLTKLWQYLPGKVRMADWSEYISKAQDEGTITLVEAGEHKWVSLTVSCALSVCCFPHLVSSPSLTFRP